MFGAYQNNANAIKIINKIAPHWNTISVKSSMNARSDILRSVKNDINIDTNTAMDIFLGNYKDVDKINVGTKCSQAQLNEAKKTLLLYPEQFDNLSKKQQDNLLTFLAKFRSTFNRLCVDSAMNIFKNIERSQQNYNYERLNKEIVNTFHDNTLAENINGSIISLFNSYDRSIKSNRDMLISDKILWCCSYYIPLVNKLSETIKANKDNETLYKQFYNKNVLMNMLPVVDTPIKNTHEAMTFTGGNTAKPMVITKYVYVGGDDKKQKSSTAEYIESLVSAQAEFNTKFEDIYRNLIKSLYTITLTDKQTTQSTSLNGCLYALKGIELNSPKTTYKISGYYSAKNWNKYYVASCYKAVEVLNKDGMGLFNETTKYINDLINLCKSSAEKANQLSDIYMRAVKISSESFGNLKNVSKIPCKMSYRELNRFGENIKRLEQLFTSISNQTSIYSTSQVLDAFLAHVQDRNDLIREYFRNKETQLKLNGSSGFNNDRVEMLLQFNNQIKQTMLYLNQTLDTKLAEYRKQKNANTTDDKLFAKFEKAMVMFKDLSNNANLRNILEKINIVLNGKDFEGNKQEEKQKKYGLDLIRIVQRFWKESGYVDFLIQLYTELNIFSDGFNWSEFRDNITLLLSIINITVSTNYSVKLSARNVDTNTEYTEHINEPKLDISIKDSASIQDAVDKIVKNITVMYPVALRSTLNVNILRTYIYNCLQQMFNYASSSDKLTGTTQPIGVNLPGVRLTNLEFTIMLYDKRFSMTLTNKADNDNGEIRLTKMIFDAMLVNVLDVINNYTSIKYTGNFKLPIQLSNIIKGGDKNMLMVEDSEGKTHGGNVFDILSVNDNNYDGVIVDATPFYISAFNILLFYYKKYNVKRIPDNAVSTPSLFFYVPKISPLYPIYKKIEAYNVDSTAKLNVNLIKTGVGVFNNYWRRAEGATPSEKLSAAIDVLLNEVNACMVYSSKLQFDALQITGKLSNNFLQNLSSNVQNLSKSLIEAINEAVVDMSMTPLQQTELFETIMRDDLNKVRQKANSEEEKLAMLIDVLTKSDDRKDAANEIYKFIDFAVMPMLETLIAYNNVFKTYDLYIVDNTTVEDQVVDLSKIKFIRSSIDPTKNGQEITYIDWLNNINNSPNRDIELTLLREQLMTSGVVNAWNTIALANNIDKCIIEKNYTEPTLWQPNIYSTWPKGNNIVIKRVKSPSISNVNSSDIMLTLYQLYPYINGKTIWDYFEATLTEFTSDIDHCFHLLMSYPNINDKFIKAINNQVHKLVDDDQDILARLGIDNETKAKLSAIKMVHELGYVKPPPYKSNYFVPQYSADKSLLQQMVVYNAGEYVPTYSNSTQKFIPIDGYNQSILVQKFSNASDMPTEYSWTDWVIQKLAECDSTYECVPYKFIEALRTQTAIGYRCQPIIFDNITVAAQPLPETAHGKYVNPITANIIARSISDKNVNKTDDNAKINPQWIANLIGIIPYMINKLKAYYNNVSSTVDYEGVNVKTELNILLTILSTFYNDIVSFCPKVGFMENLALFDNNKQYHAVAEIIPHLQKYNFENSTSSLFSKYIWANRYFFGTNTNILFPESKDYDRFEKLKAFGGNVFNNGVFSNEFNTVLTILGKILIMSSIATSANAYDGDNNKHSYMFKVMANAMYYSSELVPNVHYKFMDNVLRALVNDNATIAKYSETKNKQEQIDVADTHNIYEELKSIVDNNIKHENKNYVLTQFGNDMNASDNVVARFKNGSLSRADVVNDNMIYKLFRMLKFQNDKTINVIIPAEASGEYINMLFEMPNTFWLWLNHVASVNYATSHAKIHQYIQPGNRFNGRVISNDYIRCSKQTIYAISVAYTVHWLMNLHNLFDKTNKTPAIMFNDFVNVRDIAKTIYVYSNNTTTYDKYLYNTTGQLDDAKLQQTIKDMFFNAVGTTNNPRRRYLIHLLSSLIIFANNKLDLLNTFIDIFGIDNSTAKLLKDVYVYLQRNNIIDLFFTYYNVELQARTVETMFYSDLNAGAVYNEPNGAYNVLRNGANDERNITVFIDNNDLILDVNLINNPTVDMINRTLKVINTPDYNMAPVGGDVVSRIGVEYTEHAAVDNVYNPVFDDGSRVGGDVDITAALAINNGVIPDRNTIGDIVRGITAHNTVNPVYIINKASMSSSQRFVGGSLTGKLYNMLLSGIADVNRMSALPIQLNQEVHLIDAVKNVCYILNTIPEYKICGVVPKDTYTPQTIKYKDGELPVNIMSYVSNKVNIDVNSPINDIIYSNVYVFPPNHNAPSYSSLDITNDEINYIRRQNVYLPPEFQRLTSDIVNISRRLIFRQNGDGKIKFNAIGNVNVVLPLLSKLVNFYGFIGSSSHDENTKIKQFELHGIDNAFGLTNNDDTTNCTTEANDPLFYIMTSQDYTNGNTLLAPTNFNTVFMYYISSIYYNYNTYNVQQCVCLALYASLLSQSMSEESLFRVFDIKDYNNVLSVLNNLLGLVYVKSLKSSVNTIFKGSFVEPYMYSAHDCIINESKLSDYLKQDTDYDKFSSYHVDKTALMITQSQQPIMEINGIVYSDIDSMTAIYNFVNPTVGLLNASASILNNMESTNKYAIIGQPYNYIIDEDKTNNILEHLIGAHAKLTINGTHAINNYMNYDMFNAVKGKRFINTYMTPDMANYIANNQGDNKIVSNYIVSNELVDDSLVSILRYINSYPSLRMFKYLLSKIKALCDVHRGAGGGVADILANEMAAEKDDVVRLYQDVLMTSDITDAILNGVIPDADLDATDTEDTYYGPNRGLYEELQNQNYKYMLTPYYTDKQIAITNDTKALRLFDTCKGILNNIKEVLITTLNETTNTGFAHGLFTGGVIGVGDIVSINDLVAAFVSNSDFIGAYYSPSETYKAIYKLDIPASSLGQQVYSQLFKYSPVNTFNTDFMFALIINYFHKYTVSFNSIYNSVIFPSIIYGSAVFNTIASKYRDTFNNVNIKTNNDFTAFIHKYLTSDASAEFEKYYEYNDTTHKEDRNTNTKTYTDLINIIGNDMYDVSKMISINDKLLNVFNKYGFIGAAGNDIFMNSSLLGTLKRIDAVETFTFIILLITKYMSYYNVDTDENISYTGQIGPNPLGYNIMI